MPTKAVILDADGVLIYPWRFAEYLQREHGITREMTREFFRGVFTQCSIGQADLMEVLPSFLPKWGWQGSLEQFVQVWFQTDGVVDERLVATVQSLRQAGVTCCLASTQEKHRAKHMTEAMGFGRIFDRLFFSCSIGCSKPDPGFYEHVERCLGLAGSDLLFWDDAEANVQAASQRGWQAELYTTYEAFAEKMRPYSER